MGVRHNFVSNIADGEDDTVVRPSNWNENHVVTNLSGYELVEEKIIETPTNSFLFDNLDGDLDKEYLIISDIRLLANGADRSLDLSINGSSANIAGTNLSYNSNSVGGALVSKCVIASTAWYKDSVTHSEIKLPAKAGVLRFIEKEACIITTDYAYVYGNRASHVHTDFNNKITSIGGSTDSTFTGSIRLYKKIATETPLKTGIVELDGYEVVEEKILPAGTTTTTFEGLDGNVDEEYVIESDLIVVDSGDVPSVTIRPNNTDNSNCFTNFNYSQDTTSGGFAGLAGMVLAYASFEETSRVNSRVNLFVKSGNMRLSDLKMNWKSGNHIGKWNGTGYWNNSVDNITSLVVASVNSTFGGIIRLLRKVKVVSNKPKNYLGYELVEEKVISEPVNSVIFENIDGDSTDELILEGDLEIAVTSNDGNIWVRPNSSTSIYGTGYSNTSSGSGGFTENGGIRFCCGGWSYGGESTAKVSIKSKSGKRRLFNAEVTSRCFNGNYLHQWVGGAWDNSVDNITSLLLAQDAGATFKGIIRLWKKIPVI